ncbi:MAG: hypothetical protein U0822_25915 [Anaerolineae bacterium]
MDKNAPNKDQPQHPIGAITITLIFIITLIILWSWVYLILLGRGMTG